jgi:hypothetical protein
VRSVERQRDVEAVVLAALIDAYPDELTESAVKRELTSVENTPQRLMAIGEAVEGLVEVGLVTRDADHLRLTPPALRAGELELGI